MSVFQLPDQQPLHDALYALRVPQVPQMRLVDAVTEVHASGRDLRLKLAMGYPANHLQTELEDAIRRALARQFDSLQIDWVWQVARVQPQNSQSQIPGVKNIVAIASGKGGVGKSTTTANLALALAALGARVGVLDADIYGPSQAHMLGVRDLRPQMLAPDTMQPIPCPGGVQLMSMGNLVTDNTPMVWRGPMVSGALQQLLRNTRWEDVDYLLVDMPPGTGDVQLTLSQTVPVSGAVIVTTPQDIALLDARKGIEMFRKVSIPVLGVVENMATHACSQCGHTEAIFGEGGGESLAKDYQVEVLGRLPLQLDIREQTDRGTPPVVESPESSTSLQYREIALGLAGALWHLSESGAAAPEISESDD